VYPPITLGCDNEAPSKPIARGNGFVAWLRRLCAERARGSTNGCRLSSDRKFQGHERAVAVPDGAYNEIVLASVGFFMCERYGTTIRVNLLEVS